MSNYISSAFIRIENINEHNKIINKLESMNYTNLYNSSIDNNIIIIRNGVFDNDYTIINDCIDCIEYTNGDKNRAIELFLELSKVTKNPHRNWLIHKITNDIFNPLKGWRSGNFRLATPLEIAEAYKEGKI